MKFMYYLNVFSFLIFNLYFSVFANSIDFGSRNSAIKVSDGATFYVSSNNAVFDEGTLTKDNLSQIAGNNIAFNSGILDSNGVECLLTGVLNTTDPDSILLSGNSFLDAEPGTIFEQLFVSSSNNELFGQPLFNKSIILQDASSVLTIALQNRLNKNISLNNGLLQLSDDLKLADNVKVVGPGIITLNNRQFSFGSYYSSAWAEDINWVGATDMVLNGKTSLTGEWAFTGESTLNGNGNVLDLSGGGKIRVAPGATLYLVDVYIKGIGNTGVLVGDYDTSQIRLYNSQIEFAASYTFTSGKFFIDGSSTFIVSDETVNFYNDSNLTVDGVTLWLDPLDHEALFTDLEGGNLTLVNSGTVRDVTGYSSSGGGGCETCHTNIVNGPLTGDIILNGSGFINPGERVEVAGNLTIDGKGAVIVFADPEHAQFVVRKGYTVTLKNIELDRIHAQTFDLRWSSQFVGGKWTIINSQINIGENVVFGLSEDVTFSQGLINIIRKTNGDPNVFYVKGVDGKNRLVFNPTDEYKLAAIRAGLAMNPGSNPVLLSLNDNTMGIQFIDLWGVKHINKTITDYIGAIGLVGGSTASFNGVGPYDMNFVIEDLDNEFRLLKDNTKFTGQILFADDGENELNVDAVLTEIINKPVDDKDRKIPRVLFGTGCVNLSSMNGRAILIFNDPKIRINNEPNGFVAEENSFLGGNSIEVYGDHIWDLYDPLTKQGPFIVEVENLTAPDPLLNNVPIITNPALAFPQFRSEIKGVIPRHQTALHLLYKNKRERFSQKMRNIEEEIDFDETRGSNLELLIKKILESLDDEEVESLLACQKKIVSPLE